MAYFRAFDIKKIAITGFPVILPGEILNVANITTGASLGTVQGDNDGNVPSSSLAASDGDVIEFTSGSYPGVFRQTLHTVQADAYEDPNNSWTTFIAEDLTTAVDLHSVDILITEDGATPIIIGSGKVGETVIIPYAAGASKTVTLPVIGTDTNNKKSATDPALANSADVDIPVAALGPTLLFENYFDSPTTVTGLQTLYADVIDGNTFLNNGDLLETTYHGTTAANGNSKQIAFEFDGNTVIAATTTANAKAWELNISMMRSDTDSLRCGAEFTVTGDPVTIANNTITGLDLTTDLDAILQGHTAAAAGDVTATKGDGQFWRSSNSSAILIDEITLDYLTDEISGATLTE